MVLNLGGYKIVVVALGDRTAVFVTCSSGGFSCVGSGFFGRTCSSGGASSFRGFGVSPSIGCSGFMSS
nr:hypothetical protein [Tanacetum cinerariifolium]